MTPKYWIKIVLGMCLVFAVGMLIRSGVDAGKNTFEEMTEGTASISIPMLGMPFRTAAGELGSINRLHVDRSSPKRISGFRLAVTLNDGVDVDQINENTAFTCLTEADSGFHDLVQFGTINFRPSNETHRLMVPAHVRDQIQNAGRETAVEAAAVAGDAAADVASDNQSGGLSIKVNGRQIVDIRGDSNGGSVLIIDPETGRRLVDISGSEAGGSVKVNTPTAPAAPATGQP
jgi:hypothetical protein